MMNLSPRPNEYEFQMVSFVDVIFVLLSFFVLGSTFGGPERDFGLGYQAAALAPGAKSSDYPSDVRVELRRQEDGHVAIKIGQARVSQDDYRAIRDKLAEINMPSIGVWIVADPTLTVDQVAKAFDAALASPMQKVKVANMQLVRSEASAWEGGP